MSDLKVGDLVVLIKNTGHPVFDRMIGTISTISKGPFMAYSEHCELYENAYELEKYGTQFFFDRLELKKIEPLDETEDEIVGLELTA